MTKRWYPAYVGIGSNLDDPVQQVRAARVALGKLPDSRTCGHSPLYRSAPMGPADQPDFINAVSAILTTLDARSLLGHLQAIEIAQGRIRDRERWGPRRIDLDLLVFGRQRFDDDELCVPHPGIAERNFVLLPLMDIAPHLAVPGLASVAKLVAALPADAPSIERLDDAVGDDETFAESSQLP